MDLGEIGNEIHSGNETETKRGNGILECGFGGNSFSTNCLVAHIVGFTSIQCLLVKSYKLYILFCGYNSGLFEEFFYGGEGGSFGVF